MLLYEYEEPSSIYAHPVLIECGSCELTFVKEWKYSEMSDNNLKIKEGICKHCINN